MNFQITHGSITRWWLVCAALCGLTSLLILQPVGAQGVSGTHPRFVPIGAGSLVDQYHDQHSLSRSMAGFKDRESADRHTVRLQQNAFEAPPLLSGNAADAYSGGNSPPMTLPNNFGFATPTAPAMAPPSTANPTTSFPTTTAPPANLRPANSSTTVFPSTALPMNPNPRGLPINTAAASYLPAGQVMLNSADMAPIARPQLNDGFATVGNSCYVSPPSSYVAAMGWGNCAGGIYQASATQAYIAPTPQVGVPPQAAPAVPAGLVPITRPSAPGVPKKPLISFGQDRNSVVVGQGLVGQPVAYVPGQCFRNWIRYIFP